MKHLLACLLLIAAPSAFADEAEWLTDVHAALDKAAAEHKFVLLDFTGSDWCGWCKKLKAEVFDQPEFIAFAKDNLVLVEVDFPHQKQLSPAQKGKANDTLFARAYKIQGYPTIILCDSTSKVVGQTGYKAGGPKVYIEHLQQILGLKPSAGVAKADEPDEPRRPPPVFVPLAPARPTYYAALASRAPPALPAAQINNETFMVGDTPGSASRHSPRAAVVCKESAKTCPHHCGICKPCELSAGGVLAPSLSSQGLPSTVMRTESADFLADDGDAGVADADFGGVADHEGLVVDHGQAELLRCSRPQGHLRRSR